MNEIGSIRANTKKKKKKYLLYCLIGGKSHKTVLIYKRYRVSSETDIQINPDTLGDMAKPVQ